jgi:hypothetical protein
MLRSLDDEDKLSVEGVHRHLHLRSRTKKVPAEVAWNAHSIRTKRTWVTTIMKECGEVEQMDKLTLEQRQTHRTVPLVRTHNAAGSIGGPGGRRTKACVDRWYSRCRGASL